MANRDENSDENLSEIRHAPPITGGIRSPLTFSYYFEDEPCPAWRSARTPRRRRPPAPRSVTGAPRRIAPEVGSPEEQRAALLDAGCSRVYLDLSSGRGGAARPELDACLASLEPGDTLVVVRLDRLGRSLPQLVTAGERPARPRDRHPFVAGGPRQHDAGRTRGPRRVRRAQRLPARAARGGHAQRPRRRARPGTAARTTARPNARSRSTRPACCWPDRRTRSPRSRGCSGVSRSTLYKHVPELGGRQVVTPPPEAREA